MILQQTPLQCQTILAKYLKVKKRTLTVLTDNYETVNSSNSNSNIIVIVISQTELIVIVVVLHFFNF
jgi:hypothetical protein